MSRLTMQGSGRKGLGIRVEREGASFKLVRFLECFTSF